MRAGCCDHRTLLCDLPLERVVRFLYLHQQAGAGNVIQCTHKNPESVSDWCNDDAGTADGRRVQALAGIEREHPNDGHNGNDHSHHSGLSVCAKVFYQGDDAWFCKRVEMQ